MSKLLNDASISTVTTLAGTEYLNPVDPSTGELSKITANNLRTWIGGGPTYYAANLSQSGTSDPTASTPINTIGGTIAFARTGAGNYTATISGASFTTDKTFVFLSNTAPVVIVTCKVISTSQIQINTYSTLSSGYADGELNGNSFKIEIYP
jgi:hypothetical protein